MAEPNEPTSNAAGRQPDVISPSQRRGFAPRRPMVAQPDPARPELEEKLANLVDSVKLLQSHITGDQPTESAPDPEQKSRRVRRFQRVGGEDAAPEGDTLVEPEVRGSETTLNNNIAWPRLTRVDEAPASAGERLGSFLKRNPLVVWILVQAIGLGLLICGYFAGESFASKNAPPADRAKGRPSKDLMTQVGVSDRAMQVADRGLAAVKKGDIDRAKAIWTEAVTSRLQLPGAEYELALLDVGLGKFTSADIHLSNSLTAGEMVASCYFIDACFARQRSDFGKVAKQFSQASHTEPFSAKYRFCWGEALRRSGKTQAAIGVIAQALDRPASLAEYDLMDFKLRLARVEMLHDDAFNAALTEHLGQTPVTADWLLLAAAQDLLHAAYPSAAAHLQQAAKLIPRRTYEALVQDYLYQSYAGRAEIGPLIRSATKSFSATPGDPNGWPLEEADPATWPPFPPAL